MSRWLDEWNTSVEASRAAGGPTAEELDRLAVENFIGRVVEITPELAKKWLAANKDNRHARPSHINNLAREIKNGKWTLTHQGIAFSSAGRLIDGQHRLEAIIAAGEPVFMAVFIGLDDNMFGALDRGIRRTLTDELRDDSRRVKPAAFIASLIMGTRSASSPWDVRKVLNVYRKDFDVMLDLAGSSPGGRASAGTRAAWVIRFHSLGSSAADQKFKQILQEQWKALIHFDIENLDSTSVALLRRLENMGADKGRETYFERGAISWLGFDRDRNKIKIIVRDQASVIEEMRTFAKKAVA